MIELKLLQAKIQIESAKLAVYGEAVGHPFRGNQWTVESAQILSAILKDLRTGKRFKDVQDAYEHAHKFGIPKKQIKEAFKNLLVRDNF